MTTAQRIPPAEAARERRDFARRTQLDFDALDGHLGYFLRRLQLRVFKDFLCTLAPFHLRPAEYSALVLIGANPGRSQAEIAEALQIERARFVRLLDGLENRGWTQRISAVRDRRSHALFLTRQGRTALAKIKNSAARHEKQVSKLVGKRRREQLMQLLQDSKTRNARPNARSRASTAGTQHRGSLFRSV